MRKIGAEVAAGAAIFFALVIFVFGFLILKNIALNTGNYEVQVRFDDVTGLEKSDYVSVSGLRVGKVKGFRLEGDGVMVTVELEPLLDLPRDSRAEIKSLGMVGEKFVDIIPGTASENLQDGDTIRGSAGTDILEIAGSADEVMEKVSKILNEIGGLFDDENKRNLREMLQHSSNLAATLDRNTLHLSRTLANMDTLSTNLNQILLERRSKVETSIDNLHAASNKLEGMTHKMDRSLTTVQTLLDKIENQEGAVGKVIARDDIYDDIRHLTAELDDLVQDLKRRPQKYINLGFIKVF